MTVPAFSLSSVLPGASPTPTGAGATATGMPAGLFDSLLAGLATPDPGAPKPGKGDAAQDPLDADPTAQDPTTASQDAGLALLLVAPGAAPVLTPLAPAAPEGESTVQAAQRQIRVPGFGVDPAAILPPSTGEGLDLLAGDAGTQQSPVVAPGAAEVPTPAVPPPSDIGQRLGERTEAVSVVGAATPATLPPAAPAKPSAPVPGPVAATPPPSAIPPAALQNAVQQAGAPQAVAQPAVVQQAAAATVPAADAIAAAGGVSAPAPARAGAPEGETRRPVSTRGERRLDAAGRPTTPADASPAKQAALAALAEAATPDGIDSGASALPDVTAADTTDTPETRQPALPGDVPLQAAQAAAVAEAAVAPRGSPETVARLAADIVRKLEGQSTRFDLELNPHGMGKVDVAIEIDRDGKLTAAMSFDSAQSAADLRGRAGELRLALEQAGFDVPDGGLTFDLASQGAGTGGREAGQQQQDRAWTGRAFQRAQSGVEEADLTLATPSTPARWTRSGVDIRI